MDRSKAQVCVTMHEMHDCTIGCVFNLGGGVYPVISVKDGNIIPD